MFTINDICNIAAQIERNGEEAYAKASRGTSDPELSLLFQQMAEEEGKHATWFGSLKINTSISQEEKELESMGRELLQDMVKDQTFSLETMDLIRSEGGEVVLDQLIGFERDTILFYEFLENIIDEEKTKKHLLIIIEEERNHVKLIEEMMEVVLGKKVVI
ncbi:MAG: ferritin family protein [Bacteroidetes bacterium]|nr:ferritin family protein [Bacteroidota bacterium]